MTFKKKMLVLVCLALVAVAGVGTSVAFILNDATQESGNLEADSGIIISWGDETTLDNIAGLTPNSPVNQSVVIDWAKSSSVTTGTIRTTFTLTTESGDLTISVADTSFSEQNTNVLATLDATDTVYTAEVDLSTAQDTTVTYYLQYLYTGASETDASGSLNVAVTYVQQ